MIRNLLTFRRSAPAAVRPAIVAPGMQKTILLVDGQPDSLRAMCLALSGESYRVETAETARAALRKVSAGLPDLIILDLRVPAADGTLLAARLLADEDMASVPIIALTDAATGAHGNREPRGAYDGQIQKPIDASAFAAQVQGFFQALGEDAARPIADLDLPADGAVSRRMEAGRVLDAIENGLPDSQFASGVRTALRRLAGVVRGLRQYELAGYLVRAERLSNASTVRARSRFGLIVRLCQEVAERDPDSAPEMAELRVDYLARRRAELSILEQAANEGDFAAIRKAGHNLKGTGTAYGFEEITEIGRSLETAAKDSDASAIETVLDQMDSYLCVVRCAPDKGEIDAADI